jgi:hypothetical protein
MGNIPVLKSREIVLLLEILGFVEVQHAALTSKFDIRPYRKPVSIYSDKA